MSHFLRSSDSQAPSEDAGAAETGGRGSLDDVVSRSVDLGYRVIDEYVRQGQRIAQGFSDRTFTPQAMTDDFQKLSSRLAEYAADFASVWVELLQLAARGGGVAPPAAAVRTDGAQASAAADRVGTPRGTAVDDAPPTSDNTRFRVKIRSSRPTEVSVDVRPGATGSALLVHSLRAVDPAKPRLTDVVLEREGAGGTYELRITVPDDQPAGTYTGIVVEERTNRPAGAVSVRIAEE